MLSQSNPNLNHNLNSNTTKKLHRKQKLLVYIHKAQKSFQVQPQQQNSPIWPKKAQNDPKKAKIKKVRKQKPYKIKVIGLNG